MAIRTSSDAVRAVVDSDSDIDITAFIRTANALTDHVESKDTGNLLSEALLIEIETWLAAHFYALRDLQFISKSTEGASASFQGQTGMRLESTFQGQTALTLDHTGILASLNRGKHNIGVQWLGKPPSTQLDYVDRD